MSALADRFTVEPEPTSTGALQAPACQCVRRSVLVDGLCRDCGREVRAPGVLGRELRRAMYERELGWAAGEGLCRRTGFKGIHAELGPNPPVERLHGALLDRLNAIEAATAGPVPLAA